MVKIYLKNSLKLFCLNLNGRQEIMTAAMQIPNRALSSRMLCNLRFVFLRGSNAGHFTTFKDAPFHKSHPYFPELFPCLCFHLNSLQNCKGEKTEPGKENCYEWDTSFWPQSKWENLIFSCKNADFGSWRQCDDETLEVHQIRRSIEIITTATFL